MSKTFKELKAGDTIFLTGNSDFIVHPDLVENFGLFKVKSVIETLDGKRNPLTCISGEYFGTSNIESPRVAYFTALSGDTINGQAASIRIDEWSEVFTRTISSYNTFLCFQDVKSGLGFLEERFKKYIADIQESREINNKVLKEVKIQICKNPEK